MPAIRISDPETLGTDEQADSDAAAKPKKTILENVMMTPFFYNGINIHLTDDHRLNKPLRTCQLLGTRLLDDKRDYIPIAIKTNWDFFARVGINIIRRTFYDGDGLTRFDMTERPEELAPAGQVRLGPPEGYSAIPGAA